MHDRTSHIAIAGYFLHVLISSSRGAQLWAEREDMPSNVQNTIREDLRAAAISQTPISYQLKTYA